MLIFRCFVFLQIFFTQLKYTYTKSTVAYTVLDLLCDIGGALGLVLGSSMLTICELMDLALMAIGGSFIEHSKKNHIQTSSSTGKEKPQEIKTVKLTVTEQ
jgi:Amiloride-sensitive sodium channel